jgi:hypothetical protein
MTHVFVMLLFFQGAPQRMEPMYFFDIDRCLYFAGRMSKQKDYSAVCKPKLVDSTKVTIYR